MNGRRVVAALLACMAALLTAFSLATAAQAHSQLVESTPGDGSVMTQAPESISFTFNEEILPNTAVIAITDERGDVVTSDKVTPDGSTIATAWPSGLANGMYQVAYRIVSADGHPVTGAIVLTLDAAGGTSSLPAQPSASSPAQPAASLSASPSADQATANSTDAGAVSPALLIGVALLAVVVVGVAFVLVRRRAH